MRYCFAFFATFVFLNSRRMWQPEKSPFPSSTAKTKTTVAKTKNEIFTHRVNPCLSTSQQNNTEFYTMNCNEAIFTH